MRGAIDGLPDDAKRGLAALRRTLKAGDVDRAGEVLVSITRRSELAALWGKSTEWRAACAGRAEEAPATLPAAFVELLHGLAPLGPTFWPVVRNEAVKASEILPMAMRFPFAGWLASRVAEILEEAERAG